MYSDPLADFLTRLRNSSRAGNKTVSIPHSQVKEAVGKVLEERGFIEKCRVDRSGKFAEIIITFVSNSPSLNLKRVSKPGQRVYRQATEIKQVRNGYGISVFSTSSGIMTGDEAKEKGVGGEYLCEVF